jgi:alpha-beta hydrolase superfamily lysophospholipase
MKKLIRLVRHLIVYLVVAVLGFVVGVLGVYIYIVRGGPDLEPWHTADLTEEFTAERAGDVRSFDDYQQLEERLFAQLDEQVYARTETGSTLMFARYSSGSESDPRDRGPDWNRSFELAADPPAGGVLLLHGMTDSPYSLRALGESLNQRGYWVVGLRLPGHGTAPSGLTTARWEDMAAAVRLGMAHLASKVGDEPIHMMGYSNGAPLAVNHALDVMDGDATTMPASLVLVSPALGVRPAAVLAKWKRRLALLPGLEQLAWAGILPEFDPYKYNSFAVNAGEQVFRLTRRVTERVETRAAAGPIESFPPTLVLLSTVDATVSVDAVIDNLLEHLAPDRHELILFDINRRNVKTSLLVSDPGPLTARLMADDTLPFHLELITNEDVESLRLVSRHNAPFSADTRVELLDHAWPRGVISLSHVALPFPPDDPLYGRRDPAATSLNLGEIDIRGERGLLLFPSDWLLRLRFNPFYDVLESRAIDWVEAASEG